MNDLDNFRNFILEGIPKVLPEKKKYDLNINHAPIRKDILSIDEKKVSTQKCLEIFL
jgi:urocanate hydratase